MYCEACETDGPCKRGDCAVGAKVPTNLAKLRELLEKRTAGLTYSRDVYAIADEAPALLDEVEKLRAALRYVLDDEPTGIPRASSSCRGVVRQALGDST